MPTPQPPKHFPWHPPPPACCRSALAEFAPTFVGKAQPHIEAAQHYWQQQLEREQAAAAAAEQGTGAAAEEEPPEVAPTLQQLHLHAPPQQPPALPQ